MRCVLLDLDGTITDPAPGILGGYAHALTMMGAAVPDLSSLGWVIGPALRTCLARLLPQGADIEAAVRHYRDYYGGGGLIEARVYDGIPEAIAAVRRRVDRVYVCTAKPTHFAVPVLEHFRLANHFDGIYGAELDGRFDDKGELIAHMTATLGLVPQTTVMIGDRLSDGRAAARNGMRAIGVSWGYGPAEELADPVFAAVCDAPHELANAVARLIS